MPILFVNQFLAVKRAIELREFLQGRHASLDEKSQHGDLDTALFMLFVGQDTECFQLGDIGIVMVGDGRNHHRIAQQIGAADFLNSPQRFALDGTEFGEVHLGPWNKTQASTPFARRCFD